MRKLTLKSRLKKASVSVQALGADLLNKIIVFGTSAIGLGFLFLISYIYIQHVGAAGRSPLRFLRRLLLTL